MKQTPLAYNNRQARSELPTIHARPSIFGNSDDDTPMELDGRISKDAQTRALEMHRLLKHKAVEHTSDSQSQTFVYQLFNSQMHLRFKLYDLTMTGDFWDIWIRDGYGWVEATDSHPLHAKLREYLNGLNDES